MISLNLSFAFSNIPNNALTVSRTHHHHVNAIIANTVPIPQRSHSNHPDTSNARATTNRNRAPKGAILPIVYQVLTCLFIFFLSVIHQCFQMLSIHRRAVLTRSIQVFRWKRISSHTMSPLLYSPIVGILFPTSNFLP